MIRINLLPVKKVKKKKKLPATLVLMVLVLFLALGAMAYLYVAQRSEISRLDRDVKKANEELVQLAEVSKQVEKFERDKKEMDRKLDIIAKLSADQHRPVRLMDAISRSLPEDIWLSNITTSDVNIKISGYAMTSVGVSNFMTRLKDTPYFQSVDLVESSATVYDRSTVYRFDLTCVLKS